MEINPSNTYSIKNEEGTVLEYCRLKYTAIERLREIRKKQGIKEKLTIEKVKC